MAKNTMGKTVKIEDAYAVYAGGGWTWHVLKVNQAPGSKKGKYASAFCYVTSPFTGGSGDYGDTYIADIGGTLIKGTDIKALFPEAKGDVLAGIFG